MILIPLLILTGLVLGRCGFPRFVGWGIVVGLLFLVHWLLIGVDPLWRMVGICSVLLGAMKGLVYSEWGGVLSWRRYLIFGLCWFGMDPGTFQTRRRGLGWKNDLMWGVGLMVLGTLGAWVVWLMEIRHILVIVNGRIVIV